MITDSVLQEKENVQKQLYAEAGNDIKKYMEKINDIVIETEKTYHIKFRYAGVDTNTK